MKRAMFLAALLFLPACSDTPTQAPLDVQPQFATVVGSGATWFFKGEVYLSQNSPAAVGDIVEGSITFTIATDDVLPDDPCLGYYYVDSKVTYTLGGQVYTVTTSYYGQAVTFTNCHPAGPMIVVNAIENESVAQLELHNPTDSEDFPLTPPAIGQWGSAFSVSNWPTGAYFAATLTEIFSGPQTKADCMKGGWVQYGFKNQGQCVRYIETGKDSR